MGKIYVKGYAERTVDYDDVEIIIDFFSKGETAVQASELVMKECEEYLSAAKKSGLDISGVALLSDYVKENSYFDDEEGGSVSCFAASRKLEVVLGFDMKLINKLRDMANKLGKAARFSISYNLSNETEIRRELKMEALKAAKTRATEMAEAIDMEIKELTAIDRPAEMSGFRGDIMCLSGFIVDEDDDYGAEYECTNELKAKSVTLSESIETEWEVG